MARLVAEAEPLIRRQKDALFDWLAAGGGGEPAGP
jgi:hypothetical protein